MEWICNNKKIEIGNKTLIMGIINVTPDSFSDGGSFFDENNAINHALELVEQGADILDFGAQSTRPGYVEISADEELNRLEPVIKAVREKTDVAISVDTYFPKVAEKVIEWGVDIVNDISGCFNEKMANIVKTTGAGWIIMHNGAGGVAEVGKFFDEMAEKCNAFGINQNQICFDMGIGFGKDRPQDLELLANISKYKKAGYPLLLGTSRKRVIGEFSCQPEAKNRVYGNIAADTACILGGADIIRIHDVKNEKQGILMADAIKRGIIKD